MFLEDTQIAQTSKGSINVFTQCLRQAVKNCKFKSLLNDVITVLVLRKSKNHVFCKLLVINCHKRGHFGKICRATERQLQYSRN